MFIKHHKIIGAVFFLAIGAWMLTFGYSENLMDSDQARKFTQDAESISVYELSEWIVENRQDFQVIELRKDEENAVSVIPGSFVSKTCQYEEVKDYLDRTKIVVIASEKRELSEKAVPCLSQKGYKVALLSEKLSSWKKVLSPTQPDENAPEGEYKLYRKRVAISNYLQGKASEPVEERKRKKAKRSLRKKAASGGDEGC